jgi:pimeloyl-ACP methyl ester carboxylesterase
VAVRKRGETPRSAFTSIHGLRLHHLEWAAPPGPPLVLLHGMRAHAYIWTRPAPYFTPPYRLLAPDLRGHGESAWSDEGYGTPRYLADFAAWADAQRLERFRLVGHSAGGRVAVAYAAAHPERVERLVVVDVGPDMTPMQPFDPALAAQPQRTFADLDEAVVVLRERYPTIGSAYLRRLARWSVRPGPDDDRLTWKWDKRVRGRLPPPDEFRADLRALRCPTLVVRGGERAYLTAEGAARMQALVPDCRVVTLAGTGHCLMEERPATFAAIVRHFLDEAVPPASMPPGRSARQH